MAASTPRDKRPRVSHSQSGIFGRYFSSPKKHATYTNDFERRAIFIPKKLDIAFLDQENFEICRLLGGSNLTQLAICDDAYVENIVRAFYCTMTFTDNVLRAEVKGKTFVVPPDEWPSLLGMYWTGRSYEEEFPDYNKYLFTRSIVEPGNPDPPSKFSVNLLTMNNRILHYFVAHILYPRGSNYSRVLDNDLFLMWVIRSGVPFNWPALICSLMVKAQASGPLPFAPFVYRIMRFQHINENGETFKKVEHGLDAHRLSQMQIKKIHNIWQRVNVPGAPDAAAEHHEDPEGAPAVDTTMDASSSSDHSLASILTALNNLQTSVSSNRTAMDSGFATFNVRQARMERRMKRIEDHYGFPPLPSPPSSPPPGPHDY